MKSSRDSIVSVQIVPILGGIGEQTVRVCVGTRTGIFECSDASLGCIDAPALQSLERYASSTIARSLQGLDICDQERIDASLTVLDMESHGTGEITPLGIVLRALSIACARAGASSQRVPLYSWLSRFVLDPSRAFRYPLPVIPIVHGRARGETNLDFREYSIVPIRRLYARNPMNQTQELQRLIKVVEAFGVLLNKHGLGSSIGKLGGYVSSVDSTMQVFDLMLDAIRRAGFRPGSDIALGIDLGSSTLFDDRKSEYYFNAEQSFLSREQMLELLFTWMETYPITYVQDPLDQDDWNGLSHLQSALIQRKHAIQGDSVMVAIEDGVREGVRDIQHAARVGACETVVMSMRSVRTVSDCIHRVHVVRNNRMECVLSDDGLIGDCFAADLSIALNVDAVKFGPLTHSASRSMYNRLLEIERERAIEN